ECIVLERAQGNPEAGKFQAAFREECPADFRNSRNAFSAERIQGSKQKLETGRRNAEIVQCNAQHELIVCISAQNRAPEQITSIYLVFPDQELQVRFLNFPE